MSLAVSLISHNRIVTTQAKAKSLRPYVEKLVSSAKTSSVATTKLLASRLPQNRSKLMKEIAPRFADRNGDIPESSFTTASKRRRAHGNH